MALADKWKKMASLNMTDIVYRSIIKRFEVLSGKEFASKVINSSSYNAVRNFLNGEKDGDLEGFMRIAIESTVSGKVVKVDINKDIGGVVQVKDCLEAKTYGPANDGVCHLTAGIIKAVAEKMVGKPVEVKERKCTATGSDFCEFAVILT